MVKDIKKDDRAERSLIKGQVISVFNLIDPGVWKEICPDTTRNGFCDISDARAELNNIAIHT
jgi:hypothetical protein